MPAKIVELATAIVERINDKSDYSIPFEAKRRYAPFTDIKEIKDLTVVVLDAITKTADRQTRTDFRREYKCVVAVLKKPDPQSDEAVQAQIDRFHFVVEEIEAQLEDENLADLAFVSFDEEQERDPYNIELLKGLGALATAITLEYADG